MRAHPTHRRHYRLAAAVAVPVLLGLASCTGEADPSFTDTDPTTTTTSAESSSAAASSSAAVVVPASCPDLLPTTSVDTALAKQLPGTIQYVVGEPEPDIQRVARVTCSYGVKGTKVPLQASLFVYADAAAAKARLDSVVASARAGGSTSTTVTVGSAGAIVLASGKDSTVLVPVAERTYSVTIQANVIPAPKVRPALVAMAKAMLDAAG